MKQPGQPLPNRDMDMLLAECKRLRALLDAQWQPISTAPKDGTRILGYSADRSKYIDQKHSAGMAVVFWGIHGWHSRKLATANYITHWQHLPNPPVSP